MLIGFLFGGGGCPRGRRVAGNMCLTERRSLSQSGPSIPPFPYKAFGKMLALTLMGAYEELTLLEAEVPLLERSGLAAAVRADWLMAPATENGWSDLFGERLLT